MTNNSPNRVPGPIAISSGQAIAAIVSLTAIGVTAVVALEIAGKDYSPIIAFLTAPLTVLVGLLRLDYVQGARTQELMARQQIIRDRVEQVARATNGKLDAALAIVRENASKETPPIDIPEQDTGNGS